VWDGVLCVMVVAVKCFVGGVVAGAAEHRESHARSVCVCVCERERERERERKRGSKEEHAVVLATFETQNRT